MKPLILLTETFTKNLIVVEKLNKMVFSCGKNRINRFKNSIFLCCLFIVFQSLNKVIISIETCENLRLSSCSQGLSSYAEASKYGFIHQVIDGVTVTVNTVKITFKSSAFLANVEVRIQILNF